MDDADTARPKRGRRGGRRRRKPGEEPPTASAEQDGAEMPIVAEAAFTPYVGPTPADPFGMPGLNIFDVLEQAELHPVTPPPVPRAIVIADRPAQQGTPSEPVAQAELVLTPELAEPSPAPVEPLPSEPVAGPTVQPVLVGSAEPAATPKKGWWRR